MKTEFQIGDLVVPRAWWFAKIGSMHLRGTPGIIVSKDIRKQDDLTANYMYYYTYYNMLFNHEEFRIGEADLMHFDEKNVDK